MSWFPVDDAFHSHPKAEKAGDEALGMWVRAGAHCMAYLTDGFVADWWVKRQPKGPVKAARLMTAELWRHAENAGETGYQFHDWKPECTKAHVLAAREKARQRKAKSRESHTESRVTDAVSPPSCLVPTQPNPTQPIISVVDSSGGVAQVAPNDPPPKFCPKHPSGTEISCRGCRKAREAFEAWESAQHQNQLANRRRTRELRESCVLCDDAGWVHGSDPAIKCQHRGVAHA